MGMCNIVITLFTKGVKEKGGFYVSGSKVRKRELRNEGYIAKGGDKSDDKTGNSGHIQKDASKQRTYAAGTCRQAGQETADRRPLGNGLRAAGHRNTSGIV